MLVVVVKYVGSKLKEEELIKINKYEKSNFPSFINSNS